MAYDTVYATLGGTSDHSLGGALERGRVPPSCASVSLNVGGGHRSWCASYCHTLSPPLYKEACLSRLDVDASKAAGFLKTGRESVAERWSLINEQLPLGRELE